YNKRENKKPKSTSYETLRRLREQGGSRLDEYELKEEVLYDLVSEAEYQARLQIEREGNDFIIDDDGNAFIDDETDEETDDSQYDDSPQTGDKKTEKIKPVNAFFQRVAAVTEQKSTVVESNEKESNFMSKLFEDLENDMEDVEFNVKEIDNNRLDMEILKINIENSYSLQSENIEIDMNVSNNNDCFQETAQIANCLKIFWIDAYEAS
ncbi:7757_t:CDS:2, partial [Entrophospora sp. SA101]